MYIPIGTILTYLLNKDWLILYLCQPRSGVPRWLVRLAVAAAAGTLCTIFAILHQIFNTLRSHFNRGLATGFFKQKWNIFLQELLR